MPQGDRLLRAARPRVVLLESAAVWTAAAIMHAAHVNPVEVVFASAAAAALAYATRARPLTGACVFAGAWVAATTASGPLTGPWCWPTLLWGGLTLAGLAVLHRHEAIRAAKAWKAARSDWLGRSHSLGLGGAHLIEHEETRLGDRQVLDTTGTGKLASQVARSNLAERIAQEEGLPPSRVKVSEGRIAGRVVITRRFRDPWADPIPHPLFDDAPEIELAVPCTVRRPLPVGQDPETGTPLELAVWEAGQGGKNILVVAKKRAGKSTLLNCLRERVTAADDAILVNINLSKAQEDRRWESACHLSATGPEDRKKALRILRWVEAQINERGRIPRDEAVLVPSAATPLIVVNVDEIDSLAGGRDMLDQAAKRLLAYIASKGGSEAVSLVISGQRGTADWVGGSDTRSQVDIVCLGKVGRRGEAMHAAGDMGLALPDMTSYGEGHAGVWVIAEDGDYQVGRTFNLSGLGDIAALADERAVPEGGQVPLSPRAQPARPTEPLVGAGAVEPAAVAVLDKTEDTSGIAHLDDGSLEDTLPADEQEFLHRLDAKSATNHRLAAENQALLASAPEVPADRAAEFAARRWEDEAAQTEIPPQVREVLISLLGEGTTIRAATARLGDVKRWKVGRYFNRLRWEGVARLDGKGAGAVWRLASATDGSDAPDAIG